ncbi:MAG: hypothetical protein AB8H79_03510 [Myxococcota bacterium]
MTIRTALVALSFAFLSTTASAVELEPVFEAAALTQAVAVDHSASWEAYLRQQRQERVARLRAYRQAGVFPQDPTANGFFHSFLDANGTLCAVADLMWNSGSADLVQHTAATRNDVVLSEVADGPLVDWMLTSGLTREEVAVIQVPSFDGGRAQGVRPIDPPQIALSPEDAEINRIRTHLQAALMLLQADTESSIAKAMSRLGERVNQAPPGMEGV